MVYSGNVVDRRPRQANSLVYRVPPTALRMVMNDERVGRRLGIDCSEDAIRDVWARGRTDATCLDLAERMGWLDDLAAIADELPDSLAKLLRDRTIGVVARRRGRVRNRFRTGSAVLS